MLDGSLVAPTIITTTPVHHRMNTSYVWADHIHPLMHVLTHKFPELLNTAHLE